MLHVPQGQIKVQSRVSPAHACFLAALCAQAGYGNSQLRLRALKHSKGNKSVVVVRSSFACFILYSLPKKKKKKKSIA